MEQSSQPEHDFVLVLTGISALSNDVEDALFRSGCDDATISLKRGRVYLTFTRSAPSLKAAILSAIADVRNAGINADVLRVDYCNLVSQADIARKIDRSRQLVHQYIAGIRGPGGFPGPVCEISDGSPLWLWCEVAYWLWQNDMIKEDVLRDAEDVGVINSVLDMEHQKKTRPEVTEEIVRLVGSR